MLKHILTIVILLTANTLFAAPIEEVGFSVWDRVEKISYHVNYKFDGGVGVNKFAGFRRDYRCFAQTTDLVIAKMASEEVQRALAEVKQNPKVRNAGFGMAATYDSTSQDSACPFHGQASIDVAVNGTSNRSIWIDMKSPAIDTFVLVDTLKKVYQERMAFEASNERDRADKAKEWEAVRSRHAASDSWFDLLVR